MEPKKHKCPICSGTRGRSNYFGWEDCSTCSGEGFIKAFLIKENDLFIRLRKEEYVNKEIIVFKIHPYPKVYFKESYDWYMNVALEKIDKVKEQRHLLTAVLIIAYRNAIREGYNHQLDQTLQKAYDHPRNRNTVQGIEKYIERVNNAEEAMLKRK